MLWCVSRRIIIIIIIIVIIIIIIIIIVFESHITEEFAEFTIFFLVDLIERSD